MNSHSFSAAVISALAPLGAVFVLAGCSASSPFVAQPSSNAAGDDGGSGAITDAAPSVDASLPVDASPSSSPDDSAPAPPITPPASGFDADIDAAPITLLASDAGIATFDIVSPAHCADQFARLLDCVIPPTTIEAAAGTAATPVDTILTAHRSGNCSSQYPMVLMLNATDVPPTHFHLEDGTISVRRNDGAAIAVLSITDDSGWTASAVYDDSCRVSIDVQMNAPASN